MGGVRQWDHHARRYRPSTNSYITLAPFSCANKSPPLHTRKEHERREIQCPDPEAQQIDSESQQRDPVIQRTRSNDLQASYPLRHFPLFSSKEYHFPSLGTSLLLNSPRSRWPPQAIMDRASVRIRPHKTPLDLMKSSSLSTTTLIGCAEISYAFPHPSAPLCSPSRFLLPSPPHKPRLCLKSGGGTNGTAGSPWCELGCSAELKGSGIRERIRK